MKRFYAYNLSAVSIAIVVLSLCAAEARADTKTFSAMSCYAPNLTPTILGLANLSFTETAAIRCPLLRDNPSIQPTRIEVSVIDNSTNSRKGDIKCGAIAVDRFGTGVSRGLPVSTTGTNSTGTILDLPLPALVYPAGTLVVYCVIPRRASADNPSAVASIKLTENETRN